MERAPLRPVPTRPAGPVDPAAAIREVAAALPALPPLEVRALALVALADRPRQQAAGVLGIEERELGALLAAARKELRQTIAALPGSGWCERAEGLISDRLDGVARGPDARRLDVHLRNCPRCVEHERRLVQATDALLAGVAGVGPARPDAAGPGRPEGPGPARPEGAGPARPDATGPAPTPAPAPLVPVEEERAAEDEAPKDRVPHGPEAHPPEADAPDAPAPEADAPEVDAPPAPPPALRDAGSSDAASSDQIADAAEVLATVRTRRQLAAAVTWNAMVAIAVILTIASIALIVAGILGADL